jgi:hypothetical protein
MKFTNLVEHVSKKAIPPHVKHLIVEIMVSDESDEDVEVSVFIKLEHFYFLTQSLEGSFHRYSHMIPERVRRNEVVPTYLQPLSCLSLTQFVHALPEGCELSHMHLLV